MSADTSIGIAKFKRWWRCTPVVQCIDNIEWYKENWTKEEYKQCVEDYFNPEIYTTKEEVLDKTTDIERDYCVDDDYGMWLEYWVVDLWKIDM